MSLYQPLTLFDPVHHPQRAQVSYIIVLTELCPAYFFRHSSVARPPPDYGPYRGPTGRGRY